MKIRILIQAVMAAGLLVFIGGCGSGGGTSANGKYVSKSTLAGTINPNVKGIEITLVLPSGVTVATDPTKTDGSTAQGVVSIPVTSPNAAKGATIAAKYTPASATPDNRGRVMIGVFSVSANSFEAGDFFTVVCDVAPRDTQITAGDFSTEGLKAYDMNGAEIITGATASLAL